MKKSIIVILLFFTLSAVAEPFFQDKERGWFWYEESDVLEDIPNTLENIEPIERTHVSPEPAPSQESKPLSSEWFRSNLQHFRDTAIDNPTPQNVAAYLYLQRVMLDKAQKFADMSERVVMSDHLLDENSRRPSATFAGYLKDDMASRGKDRAIKKLASIAGLWFFYHSECEFCMKEAGILKGLMHAYNFKVLAISLDGKILPGEEFPEFVTDRGQAKLLGVESTPALFLVKPGKNKGTIQIGQGLLAADEIIKRAIVLSDENQWLTHEEYKDTLKYNPIEIESKELPQLDSKTVNDPSALINSIRNSLGKKYHQDTGK